MPTAILVTLFGSVSTFTQLRHSSIFVKVSQETLSFLIRIQFLNASSNFSTQLATMRNNLIVTSRNRPLPYSPWWQMQAKRLSLRWVRCGYCHNCPLCWLSYNVTALFKHHTIVAQHIAQCKWSQLPKIKCEGYGMHRLDRFILPYYPDDLFIYILGSYCCGGRCFSSKC